MSYSLKAGAGTGPETMALVMKFGSVPNGKASWTQRGKHNLLEMPGWEKCYGKVRCPHSTPKGGHESQNRNGRAIWEHRSGPCNLGQVKPCWQGARHGDRLVPTAKRSPVPALLAQGHNKGCSMGRGGTGAWKESWFYERSLEVLGLFSLEK